VAATITDLSDDLRSPDDTMVVAGSQNSLRCRDHFKVRDVVCACAITLPPILIQDHVELTGEKSLKTIVSKRHEARSWPPMHRIFLTTVDVLEWMAVFAGLTNRADDCSFQESMFMA